MISIHPIVEGHGEVRAAPVLLRRIAREPCQRQDVSILAPHRVGRGRMLAKEGRESTRAVALGARKIAQTRQNGAIIVLLDADDDCPAELGPRLLARIQRDDIETSVVVANREYEAWFLAGAASLTRRENVLSTAVPPENPEEIRDAKGYIASDMPRILTESQIDGYARDGFVFPVRVMSAEDADMLGAQMERARAAGALRGLGETKFYLRFPWAHALATRPELLDAVEDLVGPDIFLYHNTVWSKEGGDAAYVSRHQDNTYFGHDPCEVLTVWVAVTPATVESGCMEFLPGTHKLGQLPLKAADIAGANMLSSGQTSDIDVAGRISAPVVLRPGEASIHHAFLVHGSRPNRAGHRRMGVSLIYHAPHLRQIGQCRTSALLVRGEDRFGHFDHESPPGAEDDPATIARHEAAVLGYRAKVRELGNATVARLD